MNRVQMGDLLNYIRASDNRGFTEMTVEAWADQLGDLDFEDAKAAVREHFQTQAGVWLTQGHIRAGVKRIRAARVKAIEREIDGQIQIRRADHGTPAEEVARHRQLIDWIASGRMQLADYCDYHGGTHVLAANARDRTGMVLSAARRGARQIASQATGTPDGTRGAHRSA